MWCAHLLPVDGRGIEVHNGGRSCSRHPHGRQRLLDRPFHLVAADPTDRSAPAGCGRSAGHRCHQRPSASPPWWSTSHAQVGIEADANVTGQSTSVGHEVEVVGLVPERVGFGNVPPLVRRIDPMAPVLRHRSDRPGEPDPRHQEVATRGPVGGHATSGHHEFARPDKSPLRPLNAQPRLLAQVSPRLLLFEPSGQVVSSQTAPVTLTVVM